MSIKKLSENNIIDNQNKDHQTKDNLTKFNTQIITNMQTEISIN